MITIITDTRPEYDEMMEFVQNYVCRHVSYDECLKYPPNCCDACYKDHHIKCGIRMIEPVDNPAPKDL